jgi:hypothetical protein
MAEGAVRAALVVVDVPGFDVNSLRVTSRRRDGFESQALHP